MFARFLAQSCENLFCLCSATHRRKLIVTASCCCVPPPQARGVVEAVSALHDANRGEAITKEVS